MRNKEKLGKTITMRIDDTLLNEFKEACGPVKYQNRIRQLMKKYVQDMSKEAGRRIIKDKSVNEDFLTK